MATTLPLADIQGNILRGFRPHHARHFLVRFGDPKKGAALLGRFVSGDERTLPQVSTAEHWADRPRYCLNLGLTFDGLKTLGVPDPVLGAFPPEFRGGPAEKDRASALGDDGPSAPETWRFGGTAETMPHLVLSLFSDADHGMEMEARSSQIRKALVDHDATVFDVIDAAAFEHGKIHFGYKDGIGQPRIEGTPGQDPPDMQPAAPAGDFLLGHTNQYGGDYIEDLPHELAANATYGAFRMMQQKVREFEEYLQVAGKRWKLDPELVAAKLLGRWRNGVPLTLSPDTPNADWALRDDEIDNFDFAPSGEHPITFDDKEGLRCPIGAHIRRLNPRSALVMGRPHSRRIIRRGMPYGAKFDPEQPTDEERGLIGYFLCGDLEMQFEFILGTWANRDFSTNGLRGTRDSMLGAQPEEGGKFVIRTTDTRDPIVLADLPRFVITRGAAYCLLPGIGGIRHLAGLADGT